MDQTTLDQTLISTDPDTGAVTEDPITMDENQQRPQLNRRDRSRQGVYSILFEYSVDFHPVLVIFSLFFYGLLPIFYFLPAYLAIIMKLNEGDQESAQRISERVGCVGTWLVTIAGVCLALMILFAVLAIPLASMGGAAIPSVG